MTTRSLPDLPPRSGTLVRMSKVQFGVVVVFLAALVTVTGYPLVVPSKVEAKTETSPQWEYKIEGYPDGQLVDELNKAGRAGWEVVSARRAVDNGSGVYEMILRRQVAPVAK